MKKLLILILLFCTFCTAEVEIVNDNVPYDDIYELLDLGRGYEEYSGFDDLGRAGVARAWICQDTMPLEGQKRPGLSYKPTGWIQNKYDFISGKWLYNRCHLIAWCLTAEGDNKYNLVTGTHQLNQVEMLPYEMEVLNFIRDGGEVLYRVTPEFTEEELVCRSIRIEAISLDNELVFHIRIYNEEPRVIIDYMTGENHKKNY